MRPEDLPTPLPTPPSPLQPEGVEVHAQEGNQLPIEIGESDILEPLEEIF